MEFQSNQRGSWPLSWRGRGHVLALSLAVFAGCTSADKDPVLDDVGDTDLDPIEATLGDCADGTDLGWTDLEPVFAEHCATCHASTLSGADRNGAAALINYDTEEEAKVNSALTWQVIFSEQMPFNADPLPPADAWQIWEWLSCGGPS